MVGIPSGMGDWGIRGVFHEGGRLLSKHLGDFLPIILVFIFPAALIKVLHTQFFVADYVGPQGSSYFPNPTSFWLLLLLASFWALPQLLITVGFVTMMQVLLDSIYTSELKPERRSQSLFTSVKLAFTSKAVDQTAEGSFGRFWEASKGKKLKSFLALFLCFLLWVLISGSGMNFTPDEVAAMGLPSWTVFVFTVLIATVTTVVTSYFLLVALVMLLWMWLPKTPILP